MIQSANASVEREPIIQTKKEDEYFDEKVHEVVLQNIASMQNVASQMTSKNLSSYAKDYSPND